MSVRKAHNSGRNHLRNVVDYYQQIGHEKAQSVIDSITSSYAAEGQSSSNPMLAQQPGPGQPFPPPPFGFPGRPGSIPPPPFGMPGGPPSVSGLPPRELTHIPSISTRLLPVTNILIAPGGGRGMPFPPFPPGGAGGIPPPMPGGLPFPPPGGLPPNFQFPPPGFPPPQGISPGPGMGGPGGFPGGPPAGFPGMAGDR
ncbi:MAG: hypothetical protein M1827_003672 [Pycnora praestabilis]|nr:MAG: hypothetical protein M1827_003672 [Pycnora praestabilis]